VALSSSYKAHRDFRFNADAYSDGDFKGSGRTGLGSPPEPGPDFGFSVRTETNGRDLTTTPKPTPTLTAETDTEYRRFTSFFTENHQFPPIFGVGLANWSKLTPTAEQICVNRHRQL
jgi:hypothetical protein